MSGTHHKSGFLFTKITAPRTTLRYAYLGNRLLSSALLKEDNKSSLPRRTIAYGAYSFQKLGLVSWMCSLYLDPLSLDAHSHHVLSRITIAITLNVLQDYHINHSARCALCCQFWLMLMITFERFSTFPHFLEVFSIPSGRKQLARERVNEI